MKKLLLFLILIPVILLGQYHSAGLVVVQDTSGTTSAGYVYYATDYGQYYVGDTNGYWRLLVDVQTDGQAGQVLQTDGAGTFTWTNQATTSWYGVTWDVTDDTYTRIGSLADSAASATIPSNLLPIQASLKRCVLLNDGTVAYYLKSDDSEYKANGQDADIDTTGGLADGQVMVEIVPFYSYHHWDAIDSIHTWKISQDSISGFTKVFDDTVYVGAYPASLYDITASAYVGDDAGTYASGDTLCSVSGIKPKTNETRPEFRAAAEARGTGWHLFDNKSLYALQILYLVEYANFDIQSKISEGNTKFAAWDYDADIGPTGKSNALGNFSGGQSTGSGDSLDYVSYRGIEDIFGNTWQFIDGINVNNDGSSSKLYLASNYANYADDTATNYTLMGNLVEADGFQTNVMDINNGIYPVSVGGSSSTYLCDYYFTEYDTAPSGGWRVTLVGGDAFDDSQAGVFCVHTNNGSSYASSSVSARLCHD